MKKLKLLSFSLIACICIVGAECFAQISGVGMTQWELINKQMIDLIEEGYQLQHHTFQLNSGMRVDRYFLNNGRSLAYCDDTTSWAHRDAIEVNSIFECYKLARPHYLGSGKSK